VQVTVALCTFNPSQALIVRALDAIVAQLDDVAQAELIDRGYLEGYPLEVVFQPTPGLTAAREMAIASARGEIVVFVDDDNVLCEDYLATAARMFAADPQLGLLGGAITPEYESPPPDWFGEFEHWLAIRRYPADLYVETSEPRHSPYFPVGAGLVVRRNLAAAYLDDCERSSKIEGRRGSALSSGEDLDIGFFVLSQGYKLAVSGALRMIHVIPAGRVTSQYLQRLAVGSVGSSLELERKWSSRVGGPIYPALAISSVGLRARLAKSVLLSPWSPRHRIKRALYATIARGGP
jgi:hypothetical protein